MSGSLIAAGLVLLAAGVLLAAVPGMGRLPGDVTLGGDGWTVHVPLGTSIALSVILTLAVAATRRFFR